MRIKTCGTMLRTGGVDDASKRTVGQVAATVVLSLLYAATVNACIFGSDEDLAETMRQDRIKQLHMAADLARQADTIIIAKAIGETFGKTAFKIQEIIKISRRSRGRTFWAVGDEIGFRRTSGDIGIVCVPSQAFLNRGSLIGHEYILYAKDGVLLRAGNTMRYGPEITVSAEVQAVERVIAASKRSAKPH